MTAAFSAMVSGGFDLNILVLDTAPRPLLGCRLVDDAGGFRGAG